MSNRPTREAILAARKKVTVDIPELGQKFILRELSIGQMKQMKSDDVAQQLSLMIVDDEGNLLFSDDEGIAILSELSATTTMQLIQAAAQLNNVGQAAVDHIVKNLIPNPTNDSASA